MLFKNASQFWTLDIRSKVNLSLYGSLVLNMTYAIFHLVLSILHKSYWFSSIACYYFILSGLRIFLLRHTRKYRPGENILLELNKYKICGMVFLIINLMLSIMVFFMIYWSRTFHHHKITTIAMATYTFTAFTLAIINAVKYKKYNSPVYSASKAISLASASVSMLTLTTTMLTTFGKDTMDKTSRNIFLGTAGGVISVFIIGMAIFIILNANKKIKILNEGVCK